MKGQLGRGKSGNQEIKLRSRTRKLKTQKIAEILLEVEAEAGK
jgi:hypothetical protein